MTTVNETPLRTHLKIRGNPVKLCRLTGIDAPTMSKIANGRRYPTIEQAIVIELVEPELMAIQNVKPGCAMTLQMYIDRNSKRLS